MNKIEEIKHNEIELFEVYDENDLNMIPAGNKPFNIRIWYNNTETIPPTEPKWSVKVDNLYINPYIYFDKKMKYKAFVKKNKLEFCGLVYIDKNSIQENDDKSYNITFIGITDFPELGPMTT